MMRRRVTLGRWLGVIGFVPALVVAAPASAGWSPGGTPICALPGAMARPVIASDDAGGAFIAWADARQGAAPGVRMQHVDGLGNATWTANGIRVSTNLGFEDVPVVVADGAGGVLVVWRDSRTAGETDLYAQRVSGGGALLWAAGGVLVRGGAGYVDPPRACSDGGGGVIVAWSQYPSNSCVDACRDVYAQRIDVTGGRLWAPAGVPVCTASGGQSDPAIVTDYAGGAVIAWCDRRGAGADIYAQRVNADGQPQWTGNGLTVCTAAGDQTLPAVEALDMGTIVTWDDYRTGGGPYAYGQALELDGAPMVDVNGACLAPGVSSLSARGLALASGALFAFAGSPNAQKVDADGALLWGSTGITLCPGGQVGLPPQIVTDGGDGAIVVWLNTTPPAAANIYAQHIDGSGSVRWTPGGVRLGPAPSEQGLYATVADGSGGAIAAWEDTRNGGRNIYAQRVTAEGVVAPTTDVPPGAAVAVRIQPPRPNPTHGHVALVFTLADAGRVDVAILDVAGRLVRRVARNAGFGPGTHAVEWDGRDDAGRAMPGGVYLARFAAGGRVSESRIALVR